MPRILFLAEFSTLLGGERSMLAVLPYLRQAGLEIHVAAPPRGPLARALAELNIPCLPLNMRDSAGVRYPLDRLRADLRDLIERAGPNLVHANSLTMARISGPVVRQLGMPSVGHLRDILRLSRPAVVDLNCHAALVAVSRHTCAYHLAQGIDRQRVVVLHNGVDLETFQVPAGRALPASDGPAPAGSIRITTIGQLGIRKGIDRVLMAARQVVRAHPTAHFLIVGARTSTKQEARAYERRLRMAAVEPPLAGHVHFLGTRNDVPRILSQTDLFVHAARQEPLGRVLIEAAAVGRPIVATRVGGTSEIFPAVCDAAILIEPNRSESDLVTDFANAIGFLIEHPHRAAQIRTNALRRATACFSAVRAARKLLRLYGMLSTRAPELQGPVIDRADDCHSE